MPAKAKRPKPDKVIEKAENSKVKRIESWDRYIHKVFKSVHGDTYTMSMKTMRIMNQFIDDMFERLATESSLLVKRHKQKTISPNDVRAAVQLIIPGELSVHAISEANKAVDRYYRSVEK